MSAEEKNTASLMMERSLAAFEIERESLAATAAALDPEEFEKAGIVIKTIRVSEKGIRESMSYPNFKFKELIKEDWEDCTFGNYLRETKILNIRFI